MCHQCASSSERDGHKIVQVRRSTYHEVLKMNEAQALLDVTDVQPYVINAAKVLFLRPRPQPRPPKGIVMPSRCLVDGRQLMDNGTLYCSIRCGIKQCALHWLWCVSLLRHRWSTACR
eukprot:GHUV01007088.1.p2 GENE.GHUV01007088.1~~GHUV01007088.1.p2  ORF type:complete len:118 (+),score=7.62 GHUV01007088.1:1597-1950(+)